MKYLIFNKKQLNKFKNKFNKKMIILIKNNKILRNYNNSNYNYMVKAKYFIFLNQ